MSCAETRMAETPHGPVEYLLEGSAGPLILGIHGAPGSCVQMQTMFDRFGLLPEFCRRLFISRPGYFGTPLDSGRSPAEQRELIAAALDALGFVSADCVIAFSCGGPVALELAKRYPEKVRRLILLSAVTGPYRLMGSSPPGRFLSFIAYSSAGMRFVELMSQYFPRAVFRQMLSFGGRVPSRKIEVDSDRFFRSPEDRRFLLDTIRQCVPFGKYAAGFRNDARQMLLLRTADYAGLAVPVLILHGRRDGDVDYRHATALCAVVPSAELVTFEHGYHLLALGRQLVAMREKIMRFCGIVEENKGN